MANPLQKVLDNAKEGMSKSYQKTMAQGVKNKMAGYVIKTDPSTTAKGNKTCAICKEAARTGAPLPPQHANCRCSIHKQ